jgi:hypothetical protein
LPAKLQRRSAVARAEPRVELAADHDIADRYSLDAVLRRGVGCDRFDEPFLLLRANRNHDFVRRKGRKSVADRKTNIRLPGNSADGVARKLFGRAFGDPLRMTERLLIVGEPVEHALPYNRHHDLDRVGLPNMRAQNVVRMLDGADDEHVSAHEGNVSQRRTEDRAAAVKPRPELPNAASKLQEFAVMRGVTERKLLDDSLLRLYRLEAWLSTHRECLLLKNVCGTKT